MTSWLEELELTEDRSAKKCKGRVFRYSENMFVSAHQSIEIRQSFRLLKKRSCPGCEKCFQFDEDLSTCDIGDIVELPDNPVHGEVYELKFVPGRADCETGCLDDWSWKLEKADG